LNNQIKQHLVTPLHPASFARAGIRDHQTVNALWILEAKILTVDKKDNQAINEPSLFYYSVYSHAATT